MFCYKCGTELPEGTAFCHICGTKMTNGDPGQYNVTAGPAGEKKPQPSVVLTVPKKKKSKKPLIFLGVLALVIVSVGVYLGIHDDDDFSNMTELTKTFASESDDVSFQYPKAWKIVDSDDENIVVRLGNEDIYSFIFVRKFPGNLGDAGNIYDMDDEYFLENFVTEGDVVESTSMVDINGFPAREVYYSTPDSNVGTLYYRTYLYYFASVTYRVDLIKKEINPIDVDRVFDDIMDSYTITAVPDESRSKSSITGEVTYKEIPVSVLLTSTPDEIIDVFGIPSELYENSLYYDDIGITVDEEGTFITGEASVFSVDGSSLNKNRDELAGIFGEPYEEGYDEEAQGCYMIDFHYMTYTISFQLSQPDDEAMRAWIYSWQTATDSNKNDVDRNVACKGAYVEKVHELSAADGTLQFALIDLIDNGVPELVVDHSGYDVSVFTWVEEEVITLMDQWPYGAMGNMGYEYLPGQNVIRNYNMESAGAIIYESYMKVNDNYKVVSIFDEELSIRYIRDTNVNGIIDEKDEYSDEPVYYCNETEISEKEYAAYQIAGDYELITGNVSADIMLDLLRGDDEVMEDYLTDSDVLIEDYYRLSGIYSDSIGYTNLSLGIYTSQEEGELAIGTVVLYMDDEETYLGDLIPLGEGVYKISLSTEDEMILEETKGDGIILLLYVNGEYVDAYRMIEHYES